MSCGRFRHLLNISRHFDCVSQIPGFRAFLAGGRGFEPRRADPESAVLPLDDPPSVLSSAQYSTVIAPAQEAAFYFPLGLDKGSAMFDNIHGL